MVRRPFWPPWLLAYLSAGGGDLLLLLLWLPSRLPICDYTLLHCGTLGRGASLVSTGTTGKPLSCTAATRGRGSSRPALRQRLAPHQRLESRVRKNGGGITPEQKITKKWKTDLWRVPLMAGSHDQKYQGDRPQISKTHRQLSNMFVQSFGVQKPEPKFRVWRGQFPNLLFPIYPSSQQCTKLYFQIPHLLGHSNFHESWTFTLLLLGTQRVLHWVVALSMTVPLTMLGDAKGKS